MKARVYRFHSLNLVIVFASLLLLSVSLAFAQDPPPQEPPAPAMPGGMPGPGMMRQEGMQRQRMMPGRGMMQGMPQMGEPEPMAALLRRPEIQKELGLTSEQLQKLEDIRFNSEKETIKHRSALQIMHLELRRLTSAENPDRAAIDKKIQETAQEEAALMRTSVNARLDARSVLTAEQRTKLQQLRK